MKLKKVIAFLLAAMMICMAAVFTASAESSYRDEQLKKFKTMQHKTVHANICNGGLFNLKSSKLYAKEVTGVDDEGNFILGPWKRVYNESNVSSCTDEIVLPGTCVAFAYSVDITWGTDFPYSGVFWNKPNQMIDDIDICMYGGCRTVRVEIKVDDNTVVDNYKCSSHKEWTP